jgi:hypothetical protein
MMRVHLDVLGWLYRLCGVSGVLTGIALELLAAGTGAAMHGVGARPLASPTVWLLGLAGAAALLVGAVLLAVGRAILLRRRLGREAALVTAVPSLIVVPFGTALAIYTFWTLLNDDARREFGHPPRAPDTIRA